MRNSGIAAAATAAVLCASALVTSACSPGSVDDATVGGSPVSCQPQFPSQEQGIASYYSVVMQLMNCQGQSVPLSIDLDTKAGTGTNLSSGGGINAVGTSVQWDNGSGTAQGPKSVVPAGNGQGGWGQMVGFTTVPYWNGKSATSPGPYDANTDANNNLKPNFSGTWTVYTPSSMLQFQVFTSLGWPYTPAYYMSANPQTQPGALATGVFLTRWQMGGGQIPIYTKNSSVAGYGSTPPDSSFVPGTCWDPLVLLNGGDPDPALPTASPVPSPTNLYNPTDWSYQGYDPGPPAVNWSFVPAGNDFPPLQNAFAAAPVMLANGDVATNGEQDLQVPLRSSTNQDRSVTPHYVKAFYRVMANQQCSGSTANVTNSVAIGANLSQINLAFAHAGDATLANSDLSGANMAATTFIGSSGTNFAYADLSDSSGTKTMLAGANMQGANLTGANLSNATVYSNPAGLDISNAKLLMTNLTGISASDWNNVVKAGTQFCGTILPGQTLPDNTNCDTLIKDQKADWSSIQPTNCDPGSCVYVSLYNNSTRTLAQGASQCSEGQTQQVASQNAPSFIAPMDTARWSWQLTAGQKADQNKNVIDCQLTYANGASGKIQTHATSNGTTATFTADSGFCIAGGQCLPLSADNETPVVVNVNQDTTYTDGTYYNIVVCDASAATKGVCPTTAALPGLPNGYGSSHHKGEQR